MYTINQLPDPFPPTLPGPRVKKKPRDQQKSRKPLEKNPATKKKHGRKEQNDDDR